MKRLIIGFAISLFAVSLVNAQVWEYDSDFAVGGDPHAVLVTPDGKIWVGGYLNPKDTLIVEQDTLITNAIRIYNPDGSLDAKIRTITVDGVTDTIVNSNRGMSLDPDGNVYFSNWDVLYRINYLTREGMHKAQPRPGSSLTEAAGTADGYTYLAHVGGGLPAYILDEDLALFSFVDDTVVGLQRSILVSADGNNVYFGKIYSGGGEGVRQYQSTDEGGAESESFALVDTFGTNFDPTGTIVNSNMWGQCLDWDANGLMWVGTYWDVGANDFTGWYALDPTQDWAIVDTIGHSFGSYVAGVAPEGGSFYSPRGIAFSADGMTAYTGDFDGGFVKKWTNASPKGPGSDLIPLSELVLITSLKDDGKLSIAVDFELKQNYPNPFNPSTTIPFSVGATKHVTLKVYDALGQLVATLINERLAPSNYSYQFDGSNLSTGTYIYRLNVDGQLVSKRMLLIK